MACEEAHELARHAARAARLQHVIEAGQGHDLDVRNQGGEAPTALLEEGTALAADQIEDRLADSPRLALGEAPRLERRHLDLEERLRVPVRLLGAPGQG